MDYFRKNLNYKNDEDIAHTLKTRQTRSQRTSLHSEFGDDLFDILSNVRGSSKLFAKRTFLWLVVENSELSKPTTLGADCKVLGRVGKEERVEF